MELCPTKLHLYIKTEIEKERHWIKCVVCVWEDAADDGMTFHMSTVLPAIEE